MRPRPPGVSCFRQQKPREKHGGNRREKRYESGHASIISTITRDSKAWSAKFSRMLLREHEKNDMVKEALSKGDNSLCIFHRLSESAMNKHAAHITTHLAKQYRGDTWRRFEDMITEERVLTVYWKDALAGTTGTCLLRAWPYDLAFLASGHVLLARKEGLMPKRALVSQEEEYVFSVSLEAGAAEQVCGDTPQPVSPAALLNAMRDFISAPGPWDVTGCFHRAGVFDPQANALIARAEDIGRHNCIDRLAGWGNDCGISFADKVLLISARLTGSLCGKALRAGFRSLVSRSAVTTDALALAREAGAALIGFARPEEDRFTLYSDTSGRMAIS